MPRVLTKLKITEVSAVDRGAGEGVRILLMKRDEPHVEEARRSYEKFLKIFTRKADAADDGDDDAGNANDHYASKVADLLVEARSFPHRAAALHHLLHKPSGQALLARMRKAADDQSAKESTMDSIHAIMKSTGIASPCAQIVQRGSTTITKEQICSAIGKVAAAERFPGLSEFQAFERIYTAQTDEGYVVRKAIDIAPTIVDATHEANDHTESSEAYDGLTAKADELRKTQPTLTKEQAFSKVFTDPKNAPLAQKAHRRPSATSVFPQPR